MLVVDLDKINIILITTGYLNQKNELDILTSCGKKKKKFCHIITYITLNMFKNKTIFITFYIIIKLHNKF